MVSVERVGIQFLIVLLININVNAFYNTFASENVMGIISRLLAKRTRTPMIIIVDKGSRSRSGLRSQNVTITGQKNVHFDDTIDEAKAKQYVKEILRSTGDENDPEVQKTNIKFKNALRDRCSSYAKCEKTCEPKKKKKKVSCQKSCKEVFDYLMLCHPPGGKGKKKPSKKPKPKKDSCESSVDCTPEKDSCASDSCAEEKNSCEQDECDVKDSCESSDECGETTKKVGTGKTMPPKWK